MTRTTLDITAQTLASELNAFINAHPDASDWQALKEGLMWRAAQHVDQNRNEVIATLSLWICEMVEPRTSLAISLASDLGITELMPLLKLQAEALAQDRFSEPTHTILLEAAIVKLTVHRQRWER